MEETYQLTLSRTLKKTASRIGFALLAAVVISELLAYAVAFFLPEYVVYSSIIIQLVGIPVAYLFLMTLPRDRSQSTPLGGKMFWTAICICIALSTIGSLLGVTVSESISSILGGAVNDPISVVAQGTSPLFLFCMTVLIAPLFEEFLFRKVIIDRLVHFGEWNTILFSALAFGLFHGNFMQFFYAFFVGAVFGYIYVKTRRIWYTILLHALLNLVSFVASFLTESGPVLSLLADFIPIFLGVASIAGLVFLTIFIVRQVKRHDPTDRPLPATFFNLGTILFYVVVAAEFVLYSIPFNN